MSYDKKDLKYPFEFQAKTYDATFGGELRLNCILHYQQQSGEDQMELFGMGFNELIKLGVVFVITSADVKINRMPVIGEKLRIETWHRGTKGVKFLRSYNWYNESGELLIEGTTVFVLVSVDEHKLCRPSVLNDKKMPMNSDCKNSVEDHKKIILPNEDLFDFVGTRKVTYSLIDANGHLNNSFYADFLTDFTDNMKSKSVKRFSIDYVSEARLSDEISVYSSVSADDKNTVYYYGSHESGICFRAKCTYGDR